MRKSIAFLLGALLALMLRYPAQSLTAASKSLQLFASSVLPALLPFFIVTTLLSQSFFPELLSRLLPVTRLFKFNAQGSCALFLGMLSGYPVGARLCGELLAQGGVRQQDAARLCALCNFAGPMFILGTLAASMLGAPFLGPALLLCHYAGGLLSALLFSFFAQKDPRKSNGPFYAPPPAQPFGTAFGQAVASAVSALMRVAGTLAFFAVLCALLESSGILPLLCRLLYPLLGEATSGLLCGLIEMTQGCALLSAQQSLSLPLRGALCCALVSFGGLSIIMQSVSFCPVSAGKYAFYKLFHGVFSGLISYFVLLRVCDSQAVFAPSASSLPPLAAFSLLPCLFLFLGALLFRKSRHCKKRPPLLR